MAPTSASCSATAPVDSAAAVNYPACTGTHEAAIGNFNGDSNPDLLVACWGGSVVSFLRGNGNGTFAAMVNYTVGASADTRSSRATSMVTAVSMPRSPIMTTPVSACSSAEATARSIPQVKYPSAQGRTRFEPETWTAMAVSIWQWPTTAPARISVLRGRVDGTFMAAVHYPTGSAPKGVAIADIDGDGLADLLSANTAGNYPTCCNPGGDTISLLLNAGGGSFAAAQTYAAGTTPFAIATGDFDGDGDLDVVTANWHSNDVTVLRNDGPVDPPPQLSNIAAGAITNTQRNDHLADQRACRHASRVRPRPSLRLQLAAADRTNDVAPGHAGRSLAEHALPLPREEP